MATITVWSDLTCPWAYVAAVRLHRTRDRLQAADLDFEFRALPYELTDQPMPGEARVRNEVAALAQVETSLFSSYDGPGWPGSTLPAFEAQKWAYRLSQDIGERFDLALRRALFLHSRNIADRRHLQEVARAEGLDPDHLGEALDTAAHRKEVVADARDAEALGVGGSPQIDLPDGASHVNPGMTVSWVRGIPLIERDHPSVYEEIVRVGVMDA